MTADRKVAELYFVHVGYLTFARMAGLQPGFKAYGEIFILGGNAMRFDYFFETNLSKHQIWGELSLNDPRGYGPVGWQKKYSRMQRQRLSTILRTAAFFTNPFFQKALANLCGND